MGKRSASIDLALDVARRSDGVYVATCDTFPDLNAEGDSYEDAASALALKLRDRLVMLTGAAGGAVRGVLKVSGDPC